MPSPSRRSPPTGGRIPSRKRRAPSPDVDIDSDDSSNDDDKDVELELETDGPRRSRAARHVTPRREIEDTPGRVVTEPSSTITVRIEQVRALGVAEGWLPDTWTRTVARPV
jgi:hypothetical protein